MQHFDDLLEPRYCLHVMISPKKKKKTPLTLVHFFPHKNPVK